jgi:hypothetical protein
MNRYQAKGGVMNFLHSRVHIDEGDAVLVKLHGTEANIRVMDDLNFRRYRSGSRHRFFGGHYRESPAVIHPPCGDWNVVVDLGGFGGKVEASVHVIH